MVPVNLSGKVKVPTFHNLLGKNRLSNEQVEEIDQKMQNMYMFKMKA